MATPDLLPDPMQLELISLSVDHATGDLTSVAAARTAEAACPLGQQKSCRVHSRYKRKWADLPMGGQALRWLVEVRRFRCQNPDCTRKIFCERLPTCAPDYARRTVRAAKVLIAIAFALGGRAGATLVEDLNSHDTLLRLMRRQVDPQLAPCVSWGWMIGVIAGANVGGDRSVDAAPLYEVIERLAASLSAL